MFGILAENESDADVLAAILRKLFNNDRLTVKRKGYDGCGGLRVKGARDIRSWAREGIARFVICHDSDDNDPSDIYNTVNDKIVIPSGVQTRCCIVVPVQEIEAWLIADEEAITAVIPSFRFAGHNRPETINSPKDWLVDESKAKNGKPLYSHKTFNAAVAKKLRLPVLKAKCPSFQQFLERLGKSV